ncbi:MAG: hypothetical protein JXA69_11825, partial [Phycisphaerae bacterium]|nr:hypothetical protein [Phycisphaerae bacterium]
FQLVDVHAPPDVHEAFRDVASAARDRATIVSRACVDEARMIPLARGQAAQQVHEAGAYADRTVNEAAGRAARFLQQLEAYAAAPQSTRTRLHFDTLAKILPTFEIYIRPPANSPTELELLFLDGAVRTRPQLPGVDVSPAQNGRGNEQLTIETLKELRGP